MTRDIQSQLWVPGGNHWKFFSYLGSLQRGGGHCRGGLWNAGLAGEPWKCLCGSLQTHSLGSGRCHLESLRSQRRYLGSGNLPSAPAAWRLFLQSQVQLFGLWYLWRVDMDQTRQPGSPKLKIKCLLFFNIFGQIHFGEDLP